MPTPWQLACLQSRFKSLENEITRVAAKYHPYSEPDTIYRALLSALKARAQHLADSCRLLGNKPDYLHSIFVDVVTDVQNLFITLSLADRVDSSRIPFELLRALSWAAQDLLQEECRTVVRLHTDYNYTIVSCRRWFSEHTWAQHWSKATGSTQKSPRATVLVLGFPSPDVGSTLLHAIAAHELGHEVLWRFNESFVAVQSDLLERAKHRFQADLVEFIEDNMRRRMGVRSQDAYDESSKWTDKALLDISRQWLTEVWADLLAARLVGPASLAAFDRISLEPGEPNETHPAGSFRRRLVKTYLERELPHIAADQVWSSVLATANLTSVRKPSSPSAPLFPIIEWLCSESVAAFSPMLEQIPSPLTSADIPFIVSAMEQYIEHLCPPNRALPSTIANTSAAVWLLMYGVWHFRLNSEKFQAFCKSLNLEANDKQNAAEDILSNLLLHGLHSSELLYRWNKRTAAVGGS